MARSKEDLRRFIVYIGKYRNRTVIDLECRAQLACVLLIVGILFAFSLTDLISRGN